MRNLTVVITVCVALLLAIGVAVVLLVDQGAPGVPNLESPPSLRLHLASIAAGLALVLIVMRWQPPGMRAWSPVILILAASLLAAELSPSGGSSESPDWLAAVPPLSHLSEWAKLAVVLIIPSALQTKERRRGWMAGQAPAALGVAVAGVAVLTFRGLSFAYVLTLALPALAMVLQSGRHRRLALGASTLIFSGMLWQVVGRPFILSRLIFSLASSRAGRCWSVTERALAPFSSFRSDPGGYDMIRCYPATSADEWVAATIVSLFEWSGLYFVLVLFAALAVACVLVSRHARDEYDRLLGVGIASLLGVQVLSHVTVVSGHFLTRGVALPFVSAEASSMVMFLVCIGLLMGVARRSAPPDRFDRRLSSPRAPGEQMEFCAGGVTSLGVAPHRGSGFGQSPRRCLIAVACPRTDTSTFFRPPAQCSP
jgi:cell division protein FtsW (lipid II flippase)